MSDAEVAARLLAIDPKGLGGLWLRDSGDELAPILEELAAALPCRNLPVAIDEERLTGGLDVSATLMAGRPVHRVGLLEEWKDGVLIVPGAERMAGGIAGRIAAAMDEGGPAIVLRDEGIDIEPPPACLTERVAFHLAGIAEPEEYRHPGLDPGPAFLASEEKEGRSRIKSGMTEEGVSAAIATAAHMLGIGSARADLFAFRTVRAHAALHDRAEPNEDDVAFAARTVLAPRATRMPAPPEAEPSPAEAQAKPRNQAERLEDLVVEAARAALPAELLASLVAGASRTRARNGHGAGARRASPLRGRPIGARAGRPGAGARLALLATLRAAAPWQRLRGRVDRIRLARDDLRIQRFEARAPSLTIFAVDASGSAAAQRLAEAKGAVELLLKQSYVKRTEVALVAIRGVGATLLLPPTRSLTRARRLLAELPGGGGTPLAAGIDAARALADAAASRGRTPALVLLTDGRANIARDGRQDRGAATDDALAAARAIAAARLDAIVIDIGARARDEAARIAGAMGARYLHLPRADSAAVHAALA